MKLLILGASGPTGRLTVEQALATGDSVTALARTPSSLDDFAGSIDVVQGDATVAGDIVKALAGCDAVIAALGRGKSIRAEEFFTRSTSAFLDAARDAGVKRVVWMSSFGVGETFDDANAMQKVMYRTFLRNIYANKAEAEVMIRASDLDWTLVYPSALMNGPMTGKYQVDDHVEMKFIARISRADVAHFMAKCVHDDRWIRRDAVITN